MPEPRFTRQTRLAEVGPEGQAKLGRARARVATAAGRVASEAIAARYLRGAGVHAEDAGEDAAAGDDPVPETPEEWVAALHPAAREVAVGALTALAVIRAVLADRPHPRLAPR